MRLLFSPHSFIIRSIARPDAPRTLSKSCSDKFALKQSTSLLSSLTSLLISPTNAYLAFLILPTTQYSSTACTRAFGSSGRLQPLADKRWHGTYTFQPFSVKTTDREFSCSRRAASSSTPLVASNISTLSTPHFQQTLIGGRLSGRKNGDLRAASAVSRRNLWKAVAQVVTVLGVPALEQALAGSTYEGLKESALLNGRREVKAEVTRLALEAWGANARDDFALEESPVQTS